VTVEKREFWLKAISTCPNCARESLEFRELETAVPFFGKVLISTYICSFCGYKHSDIICLEDHGPSKLEVKVSRPEDLRIMVARSNTASIEIPELKLRLDPAGHSQAFVTNVEGVLTRFEEALERLGVLGDAKEEVERKRIAEQIDLAKEGKLPFTLIIEDPQGNSTIVRDYNVS
jgi:zinc finger protein